MRYIIFSEYVSVSYNVLGIESVRTINKNIFHELFLYVQSKLVKRPSDQDDHVRLVPFLVRYTRTKKCVKDDHLSSVTAEKPNMEQK